MARVPQLHWSAGRLAGRRGAAAILAALIAAVAGLVLVPASPALAAPCTEPQNAPADPALWGGFEIDGNLCRNITGTTGTLDWDTVADPQPVVTDLLGTP